MKTSKENKIPIYNYYILFLMIASQFLNYADRQIIASVIPFLPPDFFSQEDINLQKGILGSAFIVLYAVFSLPAGILADRWIRKNIIAGGLFFWSFFTSICAIATSFFQLAIFRSFIGIGEATYSPSANSLLSDYFPERIRARIIGIFNIGMFAGGALGIGLAPIIAVRMGWEACFVLVGLPGIILTILAFRAREPKREITLTKYSFKTFLSSFNIVKLVVPSKDSILSKDQIVAFQLVCIAGIFFTFSVGGIIHWLTSFNIIASPFKCLNPSLSTSEEIDIITYSVGLPALISGSIGVVVSGYFADYLHGIYRNGRALAIGIAFVLSIPCVFLSITTQDKFTYVLMVCLTCFLMSSYTGPIIAIVFDIVPDHVKATSLALFNFLIHIFGDAISPPLMGEVYDRTGDIRYAFVLPLVANIIGALLILITAYKMKNLTRKRDMFYESRSI